MSRRNVGLVELLVELVEHHGIFILRVVPGSLVPLSIILIYIIQVNLFKRSGGLRHGPLFQFPLRMKSNVVRAYFAQ